MSPRIGELFAGYGGLGMGVQAALGGEIAWVSEFDKGPSKILAHRFPGVPNHGDITKIDWSQVEPVDILAGGSPCQDLSHAGARKGMTEGTRSNLWVAMREAIAQLKPGLVVWENVGGAFSANASSEVEPCAGCVGDGSGVHLRALGRVLGDLASLGFDAQWTALRAADVGAPHGRLRVFVTAHPGDGAGHGQWARTQSRQGSASAAVAAHLGHERGGASRDGWTGPADGDRGSSLTVLPTPSVADSTGGHERRGGARGEELLLKGMAKEGHLERWGPYAAAIQRWESLTRPAPAPTELGPKGNPRLSAAFSEWMMGLPAGWVTDVPDITRNEALKALGNGVVPQQAAAALRSMLGGIEAAA